MDLIPVVVSSIDIFLFITYIGVGIYLSYLYRIWKEPSIGTWAVGTLFAALSIFFHLLSIYLLNQGSFNYEGAYRIASILTFIAAWSFGIAHPIARRQTLDIIFIILLSIPLGFIIPYTFQSLEVVDLSGLVFEQFSSRFNTYDLLNFLFYGILYIIFARDSHLIYNASIKKQADATRKSIAIGHLLAWQFFAVGTASLRYLSKFAGTSVYFGMPFILLLVPLLTLGSRPFDWAREGHEPRLLLLIDEFGTPLYSWTSKNSNPLLLQGSTIASISKMLEDLVDEPVDHITVQFDNLTMYSHHSTNYYSVLITTGPHQSFQQLQKKIHSILVEDIIKQHQEIIAGFEFPFKLKWLLSQLLPNNELVVDEFQIEELLGKSGVFIKS